MALTKAPEHVQAEARFSTPKAASHFDRRRIPFLACEVILLALAVSELWIHLQVLPQRLALPFQVDYEEGNILTALVRIAHGMSPYPDPHALPNVLNPYG